MTRRFLVDAQRPRSLAMRLAEAGYETVHVVLSVRVGTGPQIVWLRIGNVGNRVLWSKVAGTLPQIVAALDLGERVIEVR